MFRAFLQNTDFKEINLSMQFDANSSKTEYKNNKQIYY